MRLPLIVTRQVPEIVEHFPTVSAAASSDVEELCRRIGAALDGRVPPRDNTRVADCDWSGVARRHVDPYQPVPRRAA